MNQLNTLYIIENLKLKLDIVYLDPPYNHRQYSSNYFLLNYILRYDKNVKIKGKTGVIEEWNRSGFCSKQKIEQSLNNVLSNIKCEYLAFSYSNEGLLNLDDLKCIFGKYFDNIVLYQRDYGRYKSQKNDDSKKIIEYLFILFKNEL
jgi:adenine-specific DNA-methyltransferase